ncbi:MAG: phenylalanine--tRNA ligase subunit beta, partial [Muribaculaceae bacterium]|nr:phenylalanine--tRNA ligase subunit beta [Muribaculaceae bacterium]
KPNVAAGQTVVVATVGTVLYDGDKEFKIKKSKIRGVESFGMICAEDEIGIGTSHDGIIVIDREVAPGMPAAEFYNITSDYVLEVDLTPNRIDAASHYGVARDLAAWMAQHRTPVQLCRPSVDGFAADRNDGAIEVSVADPADCPRYCGVTIRGLKVAESPQWLKDRLTAIGQRPINNVVDITNYLLHAMGQPLHCFDVDKIAGGRIEVKTVAEGTKFTTLDGVERTLDSRDLMICNALEPMCMAGVFGGLDSGVTESATSIFLESAYFNPTTIRKAARRHGLNTDSSFRFERGVDPNGSMYVLKLAAMMVKELAGGEICGPVVDLYPQPVKPFEVSLPYSAVNRLIGKDIPAATVDAILRSLEIDIAGCSGGVLDLRVPTYRVDVQRQCDVIEEILRIYGYNNVELSQQMRSCLSYKTPTDEADSMRELVSEQLTAQGFNEIMNNSLTARSYYEGFEPYPVDGCVELLNPLSGDLSVMRRTLLFGGLESLAHNINRRSADLMFYEFGNVYSQNPAAQSDGEKPLAAYSEGARLALWLTGDMRPASWMGSAEQVTFYHIKAVVEALLSRIGVQAKEIAFTQIDMPGLYSAAMGINTRSGKPLGSLGIVSRKLLKRFDIEQDVMYAELDWDALVKLSLKRKVTYTPLPKTHPVRRDMALLLDNEIAFERVEAVIRDSERRLLRSVWLFDVYEGKNLPEGKKSYAVAITLQDDEKTLTDKQIDAVMGKITTNLSKQLGASLR